MDFIVTVRVRVTFGKSGDETLIVNVVWEPVYLYEIMYTP